MGKGKLLSTSQESRTGQARDQEKHLVRHFNASLLAERIESKLGFVRFEHVIKYWLRTGSKRLNGVLGSRDHGIAYGKLVEIRGKKHGGKTLIATILAAKAQQDGAGVGRIDLENSQDDAWDIMYGLDPSSVITIRPEIGYSPTVKVKKDKLVISKKRITSDSIPEMKTAEQIFAEAQMGMHLLRKMGFKKQFWFLDSIAQIRTRKQLTASGGGKNMPSAMNRAQFLSDILPEWVALAAGYNACILFINQVRVNPTGYGDPETSPGGRALEHNIHVQAKVVSVKGGLLTHNGKKVGIKGKIQNFKNKAGAGSESHLDCGFKIRWKGVPKPVIEFMPVSEVESDI